MFGMHPVLFPDENIMITWFLFQLTQLLRQMNGTDAAVYAKYPNIYNLNKL